MPRSDVVLHIAGDLGKVPALPDIDGSEIRQRFGLEPQMKVLLTVGRFIGRKGHGDVIRALPKIALRVPEVRYLVVGEGPEREWLHALASELGVLERVVFAGYVDESNLQAVYCASDVFVMPSVEYANSGDYEGFGIAFSEASACGKPVIGARSGGIPEAVQDGQTGLLLQQGDVEGLSEAVLRLLEDEEYASPLGREGRRWAEEKLSWETVVDRLAGSKAPVKAPSS